MLGRFDPDYLTVPEEVIQLTARVNQKYFICRDAAGKLANAFICTANIEAADHGEAIIAGNRKVLGTFLAATWLLGFIFVYLQATEYHEAYTELGLKLSTGIYGSTFFMLTGFHGLHVTIGAIMLFVIWARCMKGHFTAQRHFAFEAVAWYWHFVDVVWLILFVFVYWI
jgi:cytochrome c oxidase subunit 3